MKELGKLLVKNGLPIRRSQQPQSQVQTPQNPQYDRPHPAYERQSKPAPTQPKVPEKLSSPPEAASPNPNDVYRQPDSWRPSARHSNVPEGLADLVMPPEEFDERLRRGRKPVPEKKKRGVCMSLCVSPEESEILRRFAASQDLTFSEWARVALFEEMGRKLPKRPGNPKDK